MSFDGLAALRARVHADPGLAMKLFAVDDAHFVDEVVRIARVMGDDVEPADVERALADARRDWTLRWIR